jgi:aspartyl-tRNA(Asn)/glutamyl-tRNA(Gln) amidotransferase subunit A
MLRVMAEPDWRDWFSLPYERRDYLDGLEAGVKDLRIAYSATLGYAAVDGEVAEIVARAAAVFESLGAKVDAVDPGFADPAEIFNTIWKVGAFNGLKGLSDAERARMDPGLQAVYAAGAAMPLESYLDATNARTALGQHMREFHERYDLLLTPALAVPPFEAGRLTPDGYDGVPAGEPNGWVYWTPFTYPFNLTQQPACALPCGFTESGLPVGLQLVGPMQNEALVLRGARAYERAHPGASRRPTF